MKVLLASSDSIALRVMDKLNSLGILGAVLTNPDAPKLRSKALVPTPIKQRAMELGIPYYQFDSLRTEARNTIAQSGCDFLLSFSFGRIFGPRFLALFDHTMNIHPSLLPESRGATPIQAAILSGKDTWGLSYQKIDIAMDEGEIYLQTTFPLDGTETVSSLEENVSLLAARNLEEALDNCIQALGKAQEGQGSYTSMIQSDSFSIDFNQGAKQVHSIIRAAYPWPKAYTSFNNNKLFVTGVYGGFKDIEYGPVKESCGQVVLFDKQKGLKVACRDGYVWLSALQIPTKKALSAKDFCNGNGQIKTARLGE